MMESSAAFTGAAPGRLDVMGGIADYSGSLVLQMSIHEQTHVEVHPRKDFICNVTSVTREGEKQTASLDYRDLLEEGQVNFDFAKNRFKKDPAKAWTAYVVGCALMLQKHKALDFRGADFYVRSSVPLGKGVSSSASLEVATMKALSDTFRLSFTGTELPVLAQRVENRIVGAPCGLMDQLASYFGKPDQLLPILCQPDQVGELISVPKNLSFIGIDSGVRHSVGGASYGDVRCAAFMGYSIILQLLGVTIPQIQEAKSKNHFSILPFKGYLCNIGVKQFEDQFSERLPITISGKDFIHEFGVTTDVVTQIDPESEYAVRQCTSHPIYENERVHRFRDLLIQMNQPSGQEAASIKELGNLMTQSHESYSRCGLGSPRTDEIVNLMKEYSDHGIAGAKITGGGSGGTVCALAVGDEGKQIVKKLHRELCKKYNTELAIFE